MKLDILAPLAIVALVGIFFSGLFFPQATLLVTPDFGRSDAWHSSFATKTLLSEALQKHQLPLWTEKLAGGYPIFAEGILGTLFIPNVLLYALFDTATAYNITLIFFIALFGVGIYTWCRLLKLTPMPCAFAATTAALSGITILQATHMMILPSLALFPWVMATLTWFVSKPSIRRASIMALIISQQIFAGFPQITFITILFAGCYCLFLAHIHKLTRRSGVLLLFALIIAVVSSVVQLAPSIEFLRQSADPAGFLPQESSFFSFPLTQLTTFIFPFAHGNPKIGTFEHFALQGNIFWENTGYIGILPIILFFSSFLFPSIRKKVLFFMLTLAGSFFLMLGRHSPLYILYSFWPLTLFRVPSRFIIPFVISLIIISTYAYAELWSRIKTKTGRGLLFLILIVHIWQLAQVWHTYHALEPTNTWLSPPESVSFVKNAQRIYSIGSAVSHNHIFLTSGWTVLAPYKGLREGLAPNSNLIWDIPSADVYAGRTLRRTNFVDGLLTKEIDVDPTHATISAFGEKVLRILGVDTILSTLPLTHTNLVSTASTAGTVIYKNPYAAPRAYLATDIRLVKTAQEAVNIFASDDFQVGKSALIEQAVRIPVSSKPGSVAIVRETPQSLTLETSSEESTLLVVCDTFYPGWQATVDNKPQPILPANIRQRAVLVPKGTHKVHFTYQPSHFILWTGISIASYVVLFIGVLFRAPFSTSRTLQEVLAPFSHHLHNLDR